ncbi:hypothetical protein BROC_01995 [Candidatus Brocadiaceae bacterium]|nr:hypothetical protein BROC_01995 [Candidatus Brocadiaceae bacterium]
MPAEGVSSTDLSLTERLQQSVTFILDSGEEVFCDDSEDTTNDDRIAAMRLLSATVLPVYRLVLKPRVPHADPNKEEAYQKFKTRVEKSVIFYLTYSEKFISGAYGAISLDERLTALRLMASVTVPVYRLTHRNQDPGDSSHFSFSDFNPMNASQQLPYRFPPSYPPPGQETEDAYEDMMGQLCLLEDILQLPPNNPVLKNVLERASIAKSKKFSPDWKPQSANTQNPAQTQKSAPTQKTTAPKPATPEFSRPTNPPHRYKPVKTEPPQEQLDLIRFSIHKQSEPELIPPTELETRFPLPTLNPKFDKIIPSPHLKRKFRKASSPPPQKPELFSDS